MNNLSGNNYPLGAKYDINAPWNQSENEPRELEVEVSITLTKKVKVLVDDYNVDVEEDEDGKYDCYDYSNCDLKQAVLDQITLPNDSIKILKHLGYTKQKDLEDLDNWKIDSLDVTEA